MTDRTTSMAEVFNHHYGPRATRIIVDEDTDHPTMLAGDPYHFDPMFPHLHRLFMAYLRAFQVWSDRIDAFRDPPHPWEHPTIHQKRVYYRAKGWRGPVNWSEKNVGIAHRKYLQAVKHLNQGQREHWERILEAWRESHDRNLPHEPVKPRGYSGTTYCAAMPTPREPRPGSPSPKNARERRAARIAKRKAAPAD